MGDSRCYRLRDGSLERLTKDQNMAEVVVDSGIMSRAAADASRLGHVLLSAVGSETLQLQVTSTDCQRTDVVLLCTDGLTRHVSEEEIRTRLASRASAETICRDLVDLAVERGGKDNVTVVAGRVREED